MDPFTMFLTSMGLSMDAMAVSISNGMCYNNYKIKNIFKVAFTFGFFQSIMPVIGYLTGSFFSESVSFLDHWIALILLSYIGIKMITDALKDINRPESCDIYNKSLTLNILILQAVATSIDAFAVGISLAVMKTDMVSSVVSIGIITFINSVIGSYLGKKFGEAFKQKAIIAGGLILIFIGFKIFIEHTT